MHLNRRSKSKLQETRFSNLKTVEVGRGRNGYGFTMTGQHPCVLSCILPGSPSDACGLKAGDCVMAINGENVTRIGHEQIIKLIGSTSGVLRLTVAEIQESESSDEEDFVPVPRVRYMRSKSVTPSSKIKTDLSREDQQTIMYKQHQLQSNVGANVASKFAPGHLSPYNQSGRAAVMLKNSASNHDYTYWNGKEFEQIRGAQKPRNVKRNSENKHYRRRPYSAQSHSSFYPEKEEDEGELPDPGLRPLTPVEVSNIMYPSLRSQARSGAQQRRLSASSGEQGVLMHAVVGYLGSIDIPASANLPMASLQAIRGCVRRLHLEQRIHSLMLMEIRNKGVSLINANHKVAVVYPAERITFSGICPDDKRCFGIVTSQNPEDNLESADSDDEPIGSSCHVFIVDPSLCSHNVHLEMAARFDVQCIHDPSTNTCQQFPTSSRPLLTYIAQLHREHGDSLHFADFYGQSPYPVGPRRSNSNSSNSDSGFGNGKENEANGHGERVMIVDVAGHIRNQRTAGQGLHEGLPNRHVVQAEINTSQSSYSISSTSSPEHSPQNGFKTSSSAGRLTPRARPDPILKDLNGRLTPLSRPSSVVLNTASGRLTPRARPDPIGFHSTQGLVGSNQEQQQTMFKERSQSVDIMIQPQYRPPNTNNTIPSLRSHVRGNDQVQVQRRHPTSTSVKGRPPTGRHSMYVKMDTGRTNSEAEVQVRKKIPVLQRDGAPVKPLQNLYLARRNSDCSEYSSSDVIKTSMHKALQAKRVLLMQGRGRDSLAASDGELDSPEADVSVKSDGNRSNPNLLQINDGQEVGRVSSWAVSFERLLQDELGLDCFTKFLKREFSEENIMFWIACETMSKMTSKSELKRMADHIYSKHLADEASMPVNLDSSCRLKVVQALKSPTPEMFKVQQQQIFKLMKYDSYSRFLKSKVYQDCLLAEMAGNPLPISVSRERSDGTSTGSVSSVDDTSEDSKKGAQQGQKGNKKKYQLWKTTKSYSLEVNEESPDKKRKSLLPWINRAKVTKKVSRDMDTAAKESDTKCKTSVGDKDLTTATNMNAKAIPVEGTCRLVFPNNDVVVLPARAGFTVRDILSPHLQVRQLSFQSVEAFLTDSKEIVDFKQDMSDMAGAEIIVEQRVVFKIELPSHRVIGVKSKPCKKLIEVLLPVTYKYNLQLDTLVVHLSNSPVPFDLDITVASLDGQRILIETLEQYGAGHYNAQARVDPSTTDINAPPLHKSASAESFIPNSHARTSQTVHLQRRLSENGANLKEVGSACGVGNQAVTLRPSISETSVSRGSQNRQYRITNHDAEELYTMLSKAQRRRMDDQRGLTIRNLELPDFLKKPNKETQNLRSKSSLGVPYQFSTPEFLHSYESLHSADKKLSFQDKAVRCKSTPPTTNPNDTGFREGIIPTHSQAEEVFGCRGRYSDITPQTFNESMTAMASDAYGYDESDIDMMGSNYGFNHSSLLYNGNMQRNQNAKLSPRAYPTDPFVNQLDVDSAKARGYSLELYDANVNEDLCDEQVFDLDQTLTKSVAEHDSILPPPPDELDRTLQLEEANYSPPPSLTKDELNPKSDFSDLMFSLPDRTGTLQGSTLPGHYTDMSPQPLTDIDSVDFSTNPPSPGPPSPSTHDLVMTPNIEENINELSEGPFGNMSFKFQQESSVFERPDVIESLHKPENFSPYVQPFIQQNTSTNSSLPYSTLQHTYDKVLKHGTSETSVSGYDFAQPNLIQQGTPQHTSEHPSSNSAISHVSHYVDQGISHQPVHQTPALQSKETISQEDNPSRMVSNLHWKDGSGVQQQKIDREKWEKVVKDGRTMRATFV
ncbi:regulator of G-protein signaling 12-like isoform X2 [Asterias rubens]|uniref:regulator of G-protein signaling 12-like isoform X2 n=1 Tax=Asterias rubens TaxID=7604 RepID=UPI0014558390|nr:regulator of G-protein signaling 12-like isoform X2 [Asterias rubens]